MENRNCGYNKKILCNYCGSDLTYAQKWRNFYGCKTCDTWVNQVVIKEEETILGIINKEGV